MAERCQFRCDYTFRRPGPHAENRCDGHEHSEETLIARSGVHGRRSRENDPDIGHCGTLFSLLPSRCALSLPFFRSLALFSLCDLSLAVLRSRFGRKRANRIDSYGVGLHLCFRARLTPTFLGVRFGSISSSFPGKTYFGEVLINFLSLSRFSLLPDSRAQWRTKIEPELEFRSADARSAANDVINESICEQEIYSSHSESVRFAHYKRLS